MNEQIKIAIDSIKNDYENGSITITKKAIDVFTQAVNIYSNDRAKIIKIGKIIMDCKPNMSALQNIISLCINELNDLEQPIDFTRSSEKIKSYMDNATKKVIDSTLKTVLEMGLDRYSIVTVSYSSTVIRFFTEMKKLDLPIKVYALESVWRGKDYAKSVVRSCKEANIEAYLLSSKSLNQNIDDLDFPVSGADSILSDGTVINGVPTRSLAKSCYQIIPFFVLAESFKKSNSSTDIKIEDGFEIIPAEYIQGNLFSGNTH
jgi:translation initiation factor 2B subunit (eIF-2B alpha/beta/delta family)